MAAERGRGAAADDVDALRARGCRRTEEHRRRARRRREDGRRGRCRGSTRSPPRRRPGGEALLEALVAEAESTWAAPHARRADVLSAEERDEARVAAELRSAAGELRALDPELLGDPPSCSTRSAPSRCGRATMTEGVLLADPLDIRARRFRAVFVCGLQDGEFPQRPVPEPFLDDEARRALSVAAGLRLPFHEDVLDRERSLFYACVSRPQEVLFLSWRSSDEEGEPLVASPFLDDVRALFTDELWEQRGRRLLAEVTWSPREAPTPRELQRAQAQARNEPDPPPLPAPVSAPVLAQLAERRTEGARQLETFAACGVRWLVEALLLAGAGDARPRADAARLAGARGAGGDAAAAASERDRLRARSRRRRCPPRWRRSTPRSTASTLEGARGAAARRTLEADLQRYLRHEAERGAGLEPTHLEWRFGREGDEHGALALGELSITGRVDRVDVGPGGEAIVRDYKGATAPPGAGWAEGGALQVALYMLAARELLGLEPVGGLYQALWGARLAPARADPRRRAGQVRGDRRGRTRPSSRRRSRRSASARSRPRAELQAGEVRACPEKCSPKGCAYPTICRAGG